MPALKLKGFLRFASRFANRIVPRFGGLFASGAQPSLSILQNSPIRVGVALVLCTTLSGCMTSTSALPTSFIDECLANRANMDQNIDWSLVQPYRMRVVNGDFRPMIMSMEQNRPYILVLENADARDRDFWAPDFLKTGVALDSIQFDDKTPATGCVNGVRLKARSKVTLRFVPVWEGRYEFRNINFALTPTVGPTGVINVVPPRFGTTVN